MVEPTAGSRNGLVHETAGLDPYTLDCEERISQVRSKDRQG